MEEAGSMDPAAVEASAEDGGSWGCGGEDRRDATLSSHVHGP